MFALSVASYAQNNSVVIRNNAFIVINGGTNGSEAVVVVDQPHQNGIITSGTGGNIITQGEFDYVKWNIGTSTGTYTVPFTADANNAKIPLTLNVTSAGTGSGYVAFSSWDVSTGAGAFDNTPWPSDVTHMAGANGNPDVSDYAVDRFWVIDINDPLGTGETYSAIPTPSINFSYNFGYAPEMADGNLLTAGLLGGQHFDPATNKWFGAGSGVGIATGIWGADNGSGLVSGVQPFAGDWFRTWTLSDFNSPLPIELNDFSLDCKEEGVIVSWETASELSADHFEIAKSSDGITFNFIASMQAVGSSNINTSYTYVDETFNSGAVFYKLIEVDQNGVHRELSISSIPSCMSDAAFDAYGNLEGDIFITINATETNDYNVILFDALGKQVAAPKPINVEVGFNKFELNYTNLAFGSYLLQIEDGENSFVKKIVIR